jgi:hypothetical protein
MNVYLSRFVLLSTMLCVGPAVVDRLAHAEEKPADAAGALAQPTAQAILRALGLADMAVPPAPAPVAAPEPAAQAPAVTVAAQAPVEPATAAWAVPPAASAPPPLPAPATPPPAQLQLAQRTVVALDETALDTMRGGFIGDGGLKISFGIERAVYVNGNLVTTTSLNLSALGTLSAGKAASLVLPDAGARLALIQSGAGNTLLTNLGPAAIGTVIQNTLDGQNIQTRTVINATVNSLSVLKSLDLQRNLRSAATDALRR